MRLSDNPKDSCYCADWSKWKIVMRNFDLSGFKILLVDTDIGKVILANHFDSMNPKTIYGPVKINRKGG